MIHDPILLYLDTHTACTTPMHMVTQRRGDASSYLDRTQRDPCGVCECVGLGPGAPVMDG